MSTVQRHQRQHQEERSASYNMFINSLQSEATKRVYSLWLEEFMEYLKLSEHDDLLKPDVKTIQSQIIDYIMHLRSRHLSKSTINVRTSAIKHFYEMNDIIGINWAKVKKFKGEATEKVEDRPYTREEIKLLVDQCFNIISLYDPIRSL